MRCRRITVALLLAGCLLAAPAAAQESELRTERAVKFIQEERYPEALSELDVALREDPDSWEAHYQRGRAFGLMGRMDEALESLLRAAELNAGMAHVHELAAIAAFAAEQHEAAWDQIILAHLAGADVADRMRRMAATVAPPPDLEERASAPRIYVMPIDLEEIESGAELPFNRNAQVRDDQNRTGVPTEILGRELAQEARADLIRVRRQFRDSIARSRLFGVVVDPTLAEYELRVSADRLAERPPRTMEGYLQLVARASREIGYRRNFDLADISAGGAIRGEIELIMDDLEAWLRDLREQTRRP